MMDMDLIVSIYVRMPLALDGVEVNILVVVERFVVA